MIPSWARLSAGGGQARSGRRCETVNGPMLPWGRRCPIVYLSPHLMSLRITSSSRGQDQAHKFRYCHGHLLVMPVMRGRTVQVRPLTERIGPQHYSPLSST
jgi:hypothetical protein